MAHHACTDRSAEAGLTRLEPQPRRRLRTCGLVILLACLLPACATRSGPGRVLDVRDGIASWYGPGFHGKTTASGARFDMHALVAAHPTLPFGTIVRVTNLANGRSVQLRILDRGPAQGPQSAGVIIDVSYGAARRLDFVRHGLTRVRVEVLRWGDGRRIVRS